jgi:hypothetical protein
MYSPYTRVSSIFSGIKMPRRRFSKTQTMPSPRPERTISRSPENDGHIESSPWHGSKFTVKKGGSRRERLCEPFNDYSFITPYHLVLARDSTHPLVQSGRRVFLTAGKENQSK